MIWQFWKKTTPISNKPVSYSRFKLDENLNSFSSFWNQERLSHLYIDPDIILQKNITKSTEYSILLNVIRLGFSATIEDIRKETEAKMKYLIIKNTIKTQIFENLYKTLDNLSEECKQEGFQECSDLAKENAKQILKAVYDNFPDYEYYIYPTEDREIAIDCSPKKGRGILILCDSNGSVAYFSTLNGKNSRFRCDNIEDFPYDLLWKTFKQLNSEKYSLSDNFTKKTSADKSFSKDSNITYDYATSGNYQYAGNY